MLQSEITERIGKKGHHRQNQEAHTGETKLVANIVAIAFGVVFKSHAILAPIDLVASW